jgi:O-antigen ligase
VSHQPATADRTPLLVRRLLLAMAFLLGALVNFWGYDAFGRPRMAMLAVVVAVGAGALVVRWREGGPLPKPNRLVWAVFAFVAAMAIATIFSTNRLVSFVGHTSRNGGLISYLLYAGVVYLMAVALAGRPVDLRRFVWALVLGSLVHSAYIFVQAVGLDPITWQLPDEGARFFPLGTMGHSNFAGAYLAMVLPPALWLAMTSRGRARTAAAAAAGILSVALLLTQSRGALLAAVAGVAAMIAVRRPPSKRVVVIAGALGVVVVIGVAVLVWNPFAALPLAELHVLRSGTLRGRIDFWVSAWRMFLARPITGFGPEGFLGNYTMFRVPHEADYAGLTTTGKPHNVYLEHASSGGLLMLVPLGILIVMAVRRGIRAGRIPGSAGLLGGAFLGSLAAYLAQAAFSIDVVPVAAMGFIAIGAIAALSRGASLPAVEAPRTPRWTSRVLIAALCATLVAVMLASEVADRSMRQALDAESGAAPELVTSAYDRATRLDPTAAIYPYRYALYLDGQTAAEAQPAAQLGLLRGAAQRYRTAWRLQPGNVKIIVALARVYTRLGWVEGRETLLEAQRFWDMALQRDPIDWEVHGRYGQALGATAAVLRQPAVARAALPELQAALQVREDKDWLWTSLAAVLQQLGRRQEAAGATRRAAAVAELVADPQRYADYLRRKAAEAS